MTDAKHVYIGGFYPKKLNDKTPEFILGRGGINIDQMIASLNELRPYAEEGFINYDIKESIKTGKRYAELNLWKQQNMSSEAENGTEIAENTKPDTRFQFKKNEPELPVIQQGQDVICDACGVQGVIANDGHDCIPF